MYLLSYLKETILDNDPSSNDKIMILKKKEILVSLFLIADEKMKLPENIEKFPEYIYNWIKTQDHVSWKNSSRKG